MAIPTCPICTSRKWRKAPGTGELICSEGHVLQGYRNETNEVTDIGSRTLHRRQLRVGRRLRAVVDKGNPDIYYGPRARYLYYQCRQLILRYQIESLVASWDLPNEAKNICRTIWLLALDVLPQPPPPQPWLHAQTEDASDRGGSAQERGEIDEEHASTAENTEEPEGSSDDEADIEAEMNLEIENLLREASETDSNPDIKKLDESEGQRAYNKKTRYTLYDSVAANVSILVLTCWWLRVPVVYSDFISLINTYQLQYLSVIPLLPDNMQKHLSTALRQELTPSHAPTVATLHVITRRIARRLHLVHGVDIPELNAAPILWRAVRAFQGPPMLYTMAKVLMERLKVPLTIHPALAPAPAPGLKKYAGDWAPIEVTMSAAIVICLKLVYGFRDANVVSEGDDPAACFPSFADYISSLRQGKEEQRRSFERLVSLDSDRTADTLNEKEIDRYLEVAERALRESHLGSLKSIPFKGLMSIYEQVHAEGQDSTIPVYVQDNFTAPEGLRRPDTRTYSDEATILPGAILTIWSPEDPLGTHPPDYALLVHTASVWSGVHSSNVNHLVATLERRLERTKGQDIENTRGSIARDSESDEEHIDTNQPDVSDEELESNGTSKDDLHRTYQMGSQKWRSRVHQRLTGTNRTNTPETGGPSSSQMSRSTSEG
ncbi:unnamed protein product [Rhizoctonia solani]|uniref:RRN7-type domain-containing protein n=1 Tax=Rhizoctonia solani TaxID=456999 RepID=A0A8H3B5Y9_9AGAM|nr:unnamed protein product [Rhizoctonia solani]